jgi:uroporphyrinogen-III decarboxylase
MRFEIDIDYPPEKMEMSRRRLAAWAHFRYVDRVPVTYCIVPRFFAPLFHLRYIDFFKDPETQFYWQLQFAKYRSENVPEDLCTGPTITVAPYFDNVVPPSGHGGEVGWTDNEPPRAVPVIHTVEQMEAFQIAHPETGLRGTSITWWRRMKELAQETRVTFNGKEGAVAVTIGTGGLSAHMIAIDLVGTDFYWWMLEYPEACHRFLQKITLGEIEAIRHLMELDPTLRTDSCWIAEDSAQIMSANMFRQFCVPYTRQLFDLFGKRERAIHMCGESRHLHQALKEDLRMTNFDLFGYLVPPRVIASNLGGTTLLRGNLNPMLMMDGTYEEVKSAAMECIVDMGPCGGLMLSDGANICPGTPLSSFRAVMEAAEEFGMGDGLLPQCDPEATGREI